MNPLGSNPYINTAIKAARKAGSIINRASMDLDLVKVGNKGPNDFVTEVDQAAEAAIIETLLTAYPNHAVLGEETGETGAQQDPDNEFTWIIDPLDGTTNFIHGFPQYAVSIALRHNGVITQGVIYDPTRNELFTASRGRGAFLNEKRIRVSKRVKFQEALIGTGFPFRASHADPELFDRYMRLFRSLTMRCAGLRRPGAAALDLAYVACGRYDAFFEYALKPWDIAAGTLMVLEAGGLVSDFQGNDSYMDSGNTVAGSPKIFAQLVAMTGEAR
ncbi:inositol monophosphatase family protein [Derxia gummosa]|uniref:Inositol-1-monophosphatase n=1 Tax=Derxia gummosa DSM 723 TaxID=1121388 RepID=A0A8B6X7W9_9BURK|nr:inositol monophosphatase family protein [Derxia gummosa]